MVVNSLGAVATAVVMLVFAVTKFRDGAWIILVLIPLLVAMFLAIHHHYKDLAARLSLDDFQSAPLVSRQRVIMPISGVHRGTLTALRYARTLSQDITVVHVSIDSADAEKVRRKWEFWGEGVRLVIFESPYRLLVEPLLQYIDKVDAQRQPNEIITGGRAGIRAKAPLGTSASHAGCAGAAPGVALEAGDHRHGCALPVGSLAG